jgi:hypothetical protein
MLAVGADGPMPEAVPGLRPAGRRARLVRPGRPERQGLAADAHDEQGRGASSGESECPSGLPSFLLAGDLVSLASSVRSRSAGRAPYHVDHGHRTRQPTWSIGTSRWARRGRRCLGPAGAWPPRRCTSDQTRGDQHVQPMFAGAAGLQARLPTGYVCPEHRHGSRILLGTATWATTEPNRQTSVLPHGEQGPEQVLDRWEVAPASSGLLPAKGSQH